MLWFEHFKLFCSVSTIAFDMAEKCWLIYHKIYEPLENTSWAIIAIHTFVNTLHTERDDPFPRTCHWSNVRVALSTMSVQLFTRRYCSKKAYCNHKVSENSMNLPQPIMGLIYKFMQLQNKEEVCYTHVEIKV